RVPRQRLLGGERRRSGAEGQSQADSLHPGLPAGTEVWSGCGQDSRLAGSPTGADLQDLVPDPGSLVPSSCAMPSAPVVQYARRLGLFSGTMAVIGGIIGSGVFLNPAIVAQRVGSARLTLGTWMLGGVVALLGAFIYGELGRRLPRAGGSYA